MQIAKYSFGKMIIDGQVYTKDLKIVRGEVVSSWFRASGHRVSLGDIRDILQAAPEAVVFGQGKPGMMKVLPEVREKFASEGILMEEMPTAKAVNRVNGLLAKGVDVAAGFHLTC